MVDVHQRPNDRSNRVQSLDLLGLETYPLGHCGIAPRLVLYATPGSLLSQNVLTFWPDRDDSLSSMMFRLVSCWTVQPDFP